MPIMAGMVYTYAVSKIKGFCIIGKCIFSIAFLGIAGIAPNFQDESPVSTEKKGTEPHIPICTKQEHGHFDIDGEPLEFGYLRIHGMG